MTTLLLIDDDVELLAMLRDYFESDGFTVVVADDPIQGYEQSLTDGFDLIVMDLMMPGTSGLELLRKIRLRSQVPVLMLTARGDDADRIVGLELGADDYVPKPCSPRELVARTRAILRRASGTSSVAGGESELLKIDQLIMWPEKRRARLGGKSLNLTSTEFNLLEVLMRHVGHPVSKEQLSTQGLGRAMSKFDRNVDVHLSSLRQKLGTLPDGRSCIQTVYRMGYQLIKE